MQIIEQIIQSVDHEVALEKNELADMRKLLTAALAETRPINLQIPEDRWIALGVHLLSVLRRLKNGDSLPKLEAAMLEQVDLDMQDLSRRVLQSTEATRQCQSDATEVLLLAVHFAAAKHNSQGN